jgi:4-amino-4-deoxy-L-arabinose transferase-like glycosyltransferase
MSKPVRWVILAAIALAAALAAALAVESTWRGAWANSDSAVYLAAANNAASGEGMRIVQPSGKYATLLGPGYPLALAGLAGFGLPTAAAARWLDVLLFPLAVILSSLAFYRYSRAPGLGAAVALLVASFPVMLENFSGALTEPLFITLMLAGALALLAYLESDRRGWLAAAGIGLGLAAVTRFIGISLLPVGVMAALLPPRGWRKRLAAAALYTGTFLIPLLVWAVWFYFNPDSTPPLGRPEWTNPWAYLEPVRNGMFRALWGWMPFSARIPIDVKAGRLAFTALVAGLWALAGLWGAFRLLGRRLERWLADPDARLALVAALVCFWYLAGFVFVYLFRNPPQDTNDRTMLPLFPMLAWLLFAALSLFARAFEPRRRWLWLLPAALALVGVAAYLPASFAMARQLRVEGRGYTVAGWQQSRTLAAAMTIPADTTIITSDSGAILYFSGRTALEISEKYRQQPAPTFTRYGDDPSDPAQALFKQGKALLVIFLPDFYWQIEPVYGERTQERIDALLAGLEPLAESADGGVYRYAPAP